MISLLLDHIQCINYVTNINNFFLTGKVWMNVNPCSKFLTWYFLYCNFQYIFSFLSFVSNVFFFAVKSIDSLSMHGQLRQNRHSIRIDTPAEFGRKKIGIYNFLTPFLFIYPYRRCTRSRSILGYLWVQDRSEYQVHPDEWTFYACKTEN